MKAIMNNDKLLNNIGLEKIHFGNQETNQPVKVVDYSEDPEKGQLIISLYSQLFSNNQLRIFIRDDKIIIVVSEHIYANQSSTAFVSDWQSYNPTSYTRMRNISLMLPGENFYLLRHFVVPEKLLLNIILGQLIDN